MNSAPFSSPALLPALLPEAESPNGPLGRPLRWLAQPGALHGWTLLVLTALGMTAMESLFYLLMPEGWAIYWPFNGIIVGVLLLYPRHRWPWIIGGFLCFLVRSEIHGADPLQDGLADILCTFTGMVIAAYALPAFQSLNQWLLSPRLVTRFSTLAVVLAPILTGIPAALYYTYRRPFWITFTNWSFADALGAALWIPLVLICFSRQTYDLFRWRSLPQTIFLLSCLSIASWYTFQQSRYPIGFLPYPLLLLVALRLGFSGAVIGANLLAVTAATSTLHGHGPFLPVLLGVISPQTIVLQIYLILAVLFVFPLSITLIERRSFEDQLRQAYAEMSLIASTDKLTGVANRRHFDHIFETEWKRAARSRLPIGLLMIDADCFKTFNDLYGHPAGDECLRQVALTLTEEGLRPHDVLARYGGEEFAILLPGSSLQHLAELAERLRLRVLGRNLVHEGNPFGIVTISVGSALAVPSLDTSREDLLSAADAALYDAKQSGRNCIRSAPSARP